METKFCKNCNESINKDAVLCVKCGVQVEDLKQDSSTIVINNQNANTDNERDKWIAFVLCFFLGVLGMHKFYERKVLIGIIYLLTGGLLGIGVLVDLILILLKPNPYHI